MPTDRGHEGRRGARPGQEGVGAGTVDGLAHSWQRVAGEDDDGDRRRAIVRLEAPAHLQAVEHGHHEVENDRIRPLARHDVDHLAPVRRLVHDEAGKGQRRDIQRPLVSGVVSDQDSRHPSSIHEDMTVSLTARVSPAPKDVQVCGIAWVYSHEAIRANARRGQMPS